MKFNLLTKERKEKKKKQSEKNKRNMNIITKIRNQLEALPYTRFKHVHFHFYKIGHGVDNKQPFPFCEACKSSSWCQELIKINEDNEEKLNNACIYICKFLYFSLFCNRDESLVSKDFTFEDGLIRFVSYEELQKREEERMKSLFRVNKRMSHKEKKEMYEEHERFLQKTEDGKGLCTICNKQFVFKMRFRHWDCQTHLQKFQSKLQE